MNATETKMTVKRALNIAYRAGVSMQLDHDSETRAALAHLEGARSAVSWRPDIKDSIAASIAVLKDLS